MMPRPYCDKKVTDDGGIPWGRECGAEAVWRLRDPLAYRCDAHVGCNAAERIRPVIPPEKWPRCVGPDCRRPIRWIHPAALGCCDDHVPLDEPGWEEVEPPCAALTPPYMAHHYGHRSGSPEQRARGRAQGLITGADWDGHPPNCPAYVPPDICWAHRPGAYCTLPRGHRGDHFDESHLHHWGVGA